MMGSAGNLSTVPAVIDTLLRVAELLQDQAKLAKLRDEFQAQVKTLNDAAAAATARIETANAVERDCVEKHAARAAEIAQAESRLTELQRGVSASRADLDAGMAKLSDGEKRLAAKTAGFESASSARAADLDSLAIEIAKQRKVAEQAAKARESALDKRERDLDARQASSEQAQAAREAAVAAAELDVAQRLTDATAMTAKLKTKLARFGELAADD